MKENVLVKVLFFSFLLILWFILLIQDIKKGKKKKTTNDGTVLLSVLQRLRQKWYDLFFLVGISGLVPALTSNTIWALSIVLTIYVLIKIVLRKVRDIKS